MSSPPSMKALTPVAISLMTTAPEPAAAMPIPAAPPTATDPAMTSALIVRVVIAVATSRPTAVTEESSR